MIKRTNELHIAALTTLLFMTFFVVILNTNASDNGMPSHAAAQVTVEPTEEVTVEPTFTLTPPPVPNDFIEFATEITGQPLPYTVSQPIAQTSVSAGDPQPSCKFGSFVNTFWYQYTPSVEQHVVIDARQSDSETNPILVVFSGTPGSLVELGCSSQAYNEGVDLTLAAGTTYYIMGAKSGWTPATSGQITLNIGVVPPVPNDDYADAIPITSFPFSHQQIVYAATTEPSDPSASCGFYSSFNRFNHTIWYQYTATADQTIMLNAEGSSYGAIIAVYTGSPGSFTEQVCNYDAGNTRASFPAQAGVQYSIMIAKDDDEPLKYLGNLALNVFTIPPVANDAFEDAVEVAGLPFDQTLDVYGSNSAPTDPKLRDYCLYGDPETYPNTVWYRYVPASSHTLSISTDGSGYQTLTGVYTLSGGSLIDYACSGNPYLTITVEAGTTYYVMVANAETYEYLPLAQSTPLQIRFDTPPVTNDLLEDATVVNSFPYTVEQEVYGSTISPGDPQGCATTFQSNSVWFEYTPTQNQGIILDATASDYRTAIKIYTRGVGDAMIEQGCGYGSLGLQVQAGVTYFIVVSHSRYDQPALLPGDQLRLQIRLPIVANDLLENPLIIPGVSYSNTQDVYGSTVTISDPKLTNTDCRSHITYALDLINTVWYQYTASTTQTLLVDTSTSDYPTFIEFPDQGICGYGIRTFEAQAGTTYRIKVAYRNQAGSPMPLPSSSMLRFILRPTVANDTQANAISILSLPFTHTQDVADATRDMSEPFSSGCGGYSQTVWFKYEPDADRTVFIDTSTSSYDTVISLFQNTTQYGCAPLTTDESNPTRFTLNARAGRTYYLMVANHSETPVVAPATLNLSITETTNSHLIENARVIPTSALSYYDIQDLGNANTGITAPFYTCDNENWTGVQSTFWYRYTPSLSMWVTVQSRVTVGIIITSVYTADDMQQVGCDPGYSGSPASVSFNALVGESYYIVVGQDTHQSAPTDPWLVQLSMSAILQAQPDALEPSGVIGTARPAFTWTSVPGVESFELTLTPDGAAPLTFTVDPATNCTDTLCSVTLDDDLALGQYEWSVVGWNSQIGNTYPSETLAFEVTPSEGTEEPTAPPTLTATPTATGTRTSTATFTATFTQTPVITGTPTSTATIDACPGPPEGICPDTPTPTRTGTFTQTFTPSATATRTPTPTATATSTSVPFGDTLAFYNPGTKGLSLVDTLLSNPPGSAYNTYTHNAPVAGSAWVMGDWNGDGQKTPGLWQAGVFRFTNGIGPATSWAAVWLGDFPGAYPVAGRFDPAFSNDCFGVARLGTTPPTAGFALSYTCEFSAALPPSGLKGQWLGINMPGTAQYQMVAGDWDGDGLDSIGARREHLFGWTNVAPAQGVGRFPTAQNFGTPSGGASYAVAGDWDNNGIDSFGLYYPASGAFYRRNDLAWNSGIYFFQQLSLPVGNAALPSSWRKNQTLTAFDVPFLTPLPVATETVIPAVTPEEVLPETTETVPPPEVTETVIPEVTPPVLPERTETVVPEVTETVVPSPFPTLPLEGPSTATPSPFPTLPIEGPSTPTPQPVFEVIALPAYASMDDGASDWQHTDGWTLSADPADGGQGLSWSVSSANTEETLRWSLPLDLRPASGQTIQLTYASLFVSTGASAIVQVSLDGVNWFSLSMPSSREQWSVETVDLSSFAGNLIYLQFVWQGSAPLDPTQFTDRWRVDEVRVASVAMPLPTATVAPTEPVSPTGVPTLVETPDPALQPTSEIGRHEDR